MSWTLTLRSTELETFRRCPRAWDLGSRNRQNYVPIVPCDVFDFDRAIRDALAVFYFPAMDDWDRKIVRPLALHAFRRKIQEHRASYEVLHPLDAAEIALWTRYSALGERFLEHYFAWCATVDDFESVLCDHELRAPVPDPAIAGRDLVAPDGRALRYVSRLDQLIAEGDELWIVHHRLADGWANVQELLDDWLGVSQAWAAEICHSQLRIAGNVYNELRVDEAPPDDPATIPDELDRRNMTGARHVNRRRDYLSPNTVPCLQARAPSSDEIVRLDGNDRFRRTYVSRARSSIEQIGEAIARDTVATTASDAPTVPRHSPDNCLRCPYGEPCDAMDAGLDVAPVLAARYRKRSELESEHEEGLRWSLARRRAAAANAAANVRFLWG
jgi:hypothetical protein